MDVTLTAFARGGVSGLVSLPQVLLKLLRLYDNAAPSPSNLARLIARDPALSAKTLALGGRAARDGEIVSLEQALSNLDANAAKSMVVGASGHRILLCRCEAWRPLLQKLWLRSMTTAHLASELAEMAEYPGTREAYLAGLFHNIGQLALAAFAPDQYPNLLAVALDGPKLAQLETGHFGIDHYVAGARLVESWQLRSFMADAVRYQAEPVDTLRDAHPLVRIVNVARGLAAGEAERAQAIEAGVEFFPRWRAARLGDAARAALERVTEEARELGVELEGEDSLPAAEDAGFELANRIRNIAILDGISQPLGESADLAELADVVRRGARIMTGASAAELLVHDADRDELSGSGSGLASELRLSARGGKSLAARAHSAGEIVQSDSDAGAKLMVADRQILKLLHSEAMICAPLVNDGESAGVLVLGVDRGDLPYSDERRVLLAHLGRRIGAAIRAANMRERPGETGARRDEFRQYVRESVHEARNPLTTVQNYVRILSNKHEGEEGAGRDLGIIGEEITRIDSILRRLSEISRGERSVPGAVAINRIIADLAHLQRTSTLDERNIDVKLDLAEDMPLLAIEPDGFKQVVVNLLRNAAEAVGDRGEIDIRTRPGVNVNGRMFARMSIKDNGKGIAPALLDTVFRSGTSNKGDGRGLGLSIVAGLVADWGGSISCASEPESGTTFDVLLPYDSAPGDKEDKDGQDGQGEYGRRRAG